MHSLSARVRELPGVDKLISQLEAGLPGVAGGLWGSASALILAALQSRIARPGLVVVPTPSEADEAAEDLTTFLGEAPERFPEMDTPDPLSVSARLRAVRRLSEGALVVASARAVIQKLPAEGRRVFLKAGEKFGRDKLLQLLADSSLERTHAVDQPGDYAVRGGLVDFFPFGEDLPIRVDFLGDAVESIRTFDVEDQRTQETLEEASFALHPLEGEEGTIADRLPENAWVALREPSEVNEEGWPELYSALSRKPRLTLQSLPGEGVNFRTLSLQRFSGVLANVAKELEELSNRRIMVFCATAGEADRLRGLVPDVPTELGRVNRGFVFEEISTAVIPNHELFNRYRLRRAPRRPEGRALDKLLDLKEGDLVVHLTHGIGRFLGIETLKGQDYLLLEYQGGTRVYVPTANSDLVQKYLGGTERSASLSTIGGKGWSEAKARAEKSAEKLAQELLEVQARREAESGIAFPTEHEWQRAPGAAEEESPP